MSAVFTLDLTTYIVQKTIYTFRIFNIKRTTSDCQCEETGYQLTMSAWTKPFQFQRGTSVIKPDINLLCKRGQKQFNYSVEYLLLNNSSTSVL